MLMTCQAMQLGDGRSRIYQYLDPLEPASQNSALRIGQKPCTFFLPLSHSQSVSFPGFSEVHPQTHERAHRSPAEKLWPNRDQQAPSVTLWGGCAACPRPLTSRPKGLIPLPC